MKNESVLADVGAEHRLYQSARSVLLFALIFAALNVFAYYFGYAFLFSSSISLWVMHFCASSFEIVSFWEYLFKVCPVALLSLVPCVLLWYASKKCSVWFLIAFLLLSADTALLFVGFSGGSIPNLLFHLLVLGCMGYGLYDVGFFHLKRNTK